MKTTSTRYVYISSPREPQSLKGRCEAVLRTAVKQVPCLGAASAPVANPQCLQTGFVNVCSVCTLPETQVAQPTPLPQVTALGGKP